MNPRIECIARGVIVCGRHVLMCRHPPGKYLVLPGGHVEFGEPGAAALGRELEEEIGPGLVVGRCIAIQEHIFSQSGKPRHEVNMVFHVEHPDSWNPASPPPLRSPETPKVELVWVAQAELAVADIRPVWDLLLETFGPDRLMFGSDWPVCVVAGGWNRWADAVAELAGELTADERDAVLAGTATRFYRLGAPRN